MAGCIITSAIERAWRIDAITLRVAPFILAELWPARMLTTLTDTIVAMIATMTRSSIKVKALRAIGVYARPSIAGLGGALLVAADVVLSAEVTVRTCRNYDKALALDLVL